MSIKENIRLSNGQKFIANIIGLSWLVFLVTLLVTRDAIAVTSFPAFVNLSLNVMLKGALWLITFVAIPASIAFTIYYAYKAVKG